MAQKVNTDLIQNLKPFIARTVATMNVGGPDHFDNAVLNPDLPLKSDANGDMTLNRLNTLYVNSSGHLRLTAGDGTASVAVNGNITFIPTSGFIFGTSSVNLSAPEVYLNGRVLVWESGGNEISTPVGAVPDLTISTDSGNLVLSPVEDVLATPTGDVVLDPSGGDIYLKATDATYLSCVPPTFPTLTTDPALGETPMTISTSNGDIRMSPGGTGKEVLVISDLRFFVEDATITTVASDLYIDPNGDLYLKGTDIYVQPLGSIFLNPVGSVQVDDTLHFPNITNSYIDSVANLNISGPNIIFTPTTGTVQIDDTLHFPSLGTSLISSAAGLYFDSAGSINIDPEDDLFINADLDFVNLNPYISTGTNLTFISTGGDVKFTASVDLIHQADTGDVVVNDSNLYVKDGIIAGSITGTGATGQLRAVKPISSTNISLALGDSGYTTGITQGLNYADSYFEIKAASPTQGGAQLRGISTSNHGIWVQGSCPNGGSLVLNGDSRAPIMMVGFKSSTYVADSDNLFVIRNNDKSKLVVNGSGTLYLQTNLYAVGGASLGNINNLATSGQIYLDDGGGIINSIQIDSPDVSHDMTFFGGSNSWFMVKRWSDDAGAILRGMSEDIIGLVLDGLVETSSSGTGNTVSAGVVLRSYKSNTAGSVQNHAAGTNLFVIRNGWETDFIFKAGGTAYANTSWTTWDEEDDMSIVRAYGRLASNAIVSEWDQFVHHNQQDLHDMGLVVNGMTNMTGMMQLHNGALWQLNTRILELENLSITGMIKLILKKWLRRLF